jgi:hydroxypyruvate isomerase
MSTPGYAVNCSILFKDRPLGQRLDAVRDAGIAAVEFWWPFESPTPPDGEVDTFIAAVRNSGLQMIGLNLYAGNMPAGDRGIISWPDHDAQVRANVDILRSLRQPLGGRAYNARSGNRRPDLSPDEHDIAAVRNLGAACEVLAEIGGTVLVEPVSGAELYPLTTARHVVDVIDQVRQQTGATNLGLLFDVYHLAVNGDDVAAAMTEHRDRIAHVQVADAPGRGAPGSGRLPLGEWLTHLRAHGYDGWIALEFASEQPDPLAWLATSDLPGLPDTQPGGLPSNERNTR